MLKKAFCFLCLSVNKRTINVYKTDLQYIYEKLADLKIRGNECWMCYICHTRLRQCHRLQRLAVQTQGLIDNLCEKKINADFGAVVSLLELSNSKTKLISTIHNSLNDIKQEFDIKAGPGVDDDISRDDILEYASNDRDEKSLIKFEVEPLKEEYLEDSEGQTAAPCADKQSIVFKVEIEERGIEQDDEQDLTDYEGRDHASETQTGCYRKRLSCDVCTKTFRYNSQLLRHVKSHTDDKPYGCDICPKRYSDKNNLKKHKQTHTGDKPFSCDICLKKFLQKSALTKHTRVHTGEKPFTCDMCSKKFSVKQSLENHIRIHTGDKPFSCNVCPMKFIERSTLLNHIKTHTGEKPFMCDICSKKFPLRASLNSHMRSHTGDKPFSCNICFKKFSRSSHVSRHRKIHKRDKP